MDIKDYLHLYIGCDVVVCDVDGQVFNDSIQSVIKEKSGRHCFSIYEFGDVPFNDSEYYQWIKLILRPLRNITKDECLEYFKMKGMPTVDAVTQIGVDGILIQMEYVSCGEICSTHAYLSGSSPKQFLYLLSHKFDLFNLIENNLAIDATTMLNKEQEVKVCDATESDSSREADNQKS